MAPILPGGKTRVEEDGVQEEGIQGLGAGESCVWTGLQLDFSWGEEESLFAGPVRIAGISNTDAFGTFGQ